MIALIHIYCSTSLCVIYKSLLIHDIQVLLYRGSTNERLPREGVAYDSYYNETDRVNYQNLIGIANEKKKPRARRRRKSDQRGGIIVLDLLLAKMISNNNRNRAQIDAMIDTMNKSQVR